MGTKIVIFSHHRKPHDGQGRCMKRRESFTARSSASLSLTLRFPAAHHKSQQASSVRGLVLRGSNQQTNQSRRDARLAAVRSSTASCDSDTNLHTKTTTKEPDARILSLSV